MKQFYQSLRVNREPLAAAGFNPYYRRLTGLRKGRTSCAGQILFDLASNDYLGLASDPRVIAAAVKSISKDGASLCGTPIATGYTESLAALELALARFVGLEAAAVFPSCYQANVALFPALASPEDLILVDHFAHASLGQGIKAAGCKVKPFLHNNMGHLAKLLANAKSFRQIFVVTESVFSTEGSIAPLDQIVELCRTYDALPIVDDSHGIGVLGQSGRGILDHYTISGFPGIYTASLGKALANFGGMLAGCETLIESLKYSCPGLIYSTALPPGCIGGILRVLQIIAEEFPTLSSRLWQNHQLLLEHLMACGFEVQLAKAPIASVRCGSTAATLKSAQDFFAHGILTTPFVPPSVPEGEGVLRLILGAKLTGPEAEGLWKQMDGVGHTKRHEILFCH